MDERAAFRRAVDQFSDWRWRLSNLYWITDKEGKRSLFQMNWAQEALFNEMHYLNVVLKARQLGFTTFIQIFMLDACVFNSDIRAGTIAHTLGDAQSIFRDKVKFPYDLLPEGIRNKVSLTKDSATELILSNNSSIRVGTSLRSGTLQYLHVSEYGKVCAKYPEKAREIRTGALNTVQSGQIAFIESTAEGQEGHFYDLCQVAQTKRRSGSRLTPLDFKFHFFPWWKSPEYEIDPKDVVVSSHMAAYFDKLEDTHDIHLNPRKRAWYAKKAETQMADMKREYPSTPEEAFEAAVEGAYYAEQLAKIELEGRIGLFKADPNYPVHAVHDIGVGDDHGIWFFQILPHGVRLVAYRSFVGEGMPYIVKQMRKLYEEKGWKLGRNRLPHDAKVKEWGTGLTRTEQFVKECPDTDLVPLSGVDDGINAARHVLGFSEFDEEDCAEGLRCLRNYKKDWNEELGCWRDRPRHDWASHGADAYRYLAMSWRAIPVEVEPEPKPIQGISEMTWDQLMSRQIPDRRERA